MNKSPTLRELAALGGVSHQTVALALRDSPKIAKPTRKRLQLLAKDAGYRRNPGVSAWVSYVRTKRAFTERATLAFICPFAPGSTGQYAFYTEFYRGAVEEADFLGYGFDVLALNTYNNDWRRIQKIMKARNIRGCMVFSQFLGGEIDLNLEDFAVVSLDRPKCRTQFDFVGSDHYKGMTVALENLRRLGYRRIGYFVVHNPHVEDLARWRGAFASDLLLRDRKDRIPIQEIEAKIPTPQAIRRWWKKHRPEAIITSCGYEVQLLQNAGVRVPEEAAVANLDVPQNDHYFSGIDQRLPAVAAAGVRLLVEKLERNETGTSQICRAISIQPVWKEGKTTPPARSIGR